MSDDTCRPISVSRRIEAPAATLFRILTDPASHATIDGSEMVQRAVTTEAVTGAGDVFVMQMKSRKWGDYEVDNHVVEFEPDRLVGWEPQAGRGHPNHGSPRLGHRWSYRLQPDGPATTVVTETYDCSRAPEDERLAMDNGNLWVESMAATLERLDTLATGGNDQPRAT